jgi:hypothetical protein
MSDEVVSPASEKAAGDGAEGIEASLRAVDRWVKRFDRDMGGPERGSEPKKERNSEAG